MTSNAPPMLLMSGTSDPIVRVQNSTAMAEKLRGQGIWVTEKFYDGFGHMEPVIALGALFFKFFRKKKDEAPPAAPPQA